jgi:hypothetical protein
MRIVRSRTKAMEFSLDALISQIYFGVETLHVSDSSSVHHQELFTQQWYMSYRFVDSFRAAGSCSKAVYKPL